MRPDVGDGGEDEGEDDKDHLRVHIWCLMLRLVSAISVDIWQV